MAVVILGIGVAACSHNLAEPQPSIDTLVALRGSDVPKMRMGDFSLAPGAPQRVDRSVTIRSVVLESPYGNSLAKYLQKTIEVDLRASGRLDPQSHLVLGGALMESGVDPGFSDGDARLGAEFSLSTDTGTVLYRKKLAVSARWDSSFIGAIAIPEAMNQWSSLFQKLAETLVTDPDFRTAAHRPSE